MPAPPDRTSYAAVLRAPYAARTFAASLTGRLSYGLVFLALMLSIIRSTGSYAVAGVFLALFGLTSAVLSPVRAGLIDRYGLRAALPLMTLAYSLVLVALAVLTWRSGASAEALWVLGAAAGSCTPPLGPVMRTLWRDMLDGDRLLRAYSLDTVAEELLYVAGPLLAGVFTALAHPALGVAASAGLVLTGVLLLLASPAVQAAQTRADDRREADARRDEHGRQDDDGSEPAESAAPLARRSSVVAAVLVSAGVGMCLGALNLIVAAFAARYHDVAAVAWVEAALSAGSVLGGLLNGALPWRGTPAAHLSRLAAALGMAVAAAGSSTNIGVLTALVGVAGLFVAPALATAYLVADQAALPNARTRAGAWVNTGFNLGDVGGAAGSGLLVATLPLGLCFLLAGVPAALSAAAPLAGGKRS